MNSTLEKIQQLVKLNDVRISEHGYDELINDNLTAKEVINGVSNAKLIEDYPNFPKGPAALVLQKDKNNNPIHVVWGIPKGHQKPAVLVTAYRPSKQYWQNNFMERK